MGGNYLCVLENVENFYFDDLAIQIKKSACPVCSVDIMFKTKFRTFLTKFQTQVSCNWSHSSCGLVFATSCDRQYDNETEEEKKNFNIF